MDNKNIIKVETSGIFTNYIFKAIPLAFDESLSYYETLCGLLSSLKTVESALNNNADFISELESYVKNYFTNLDVQTEINNKLDQMALDGTLQEIIEKYVTLNAVIGFSDLDELIASTNLIDGSYARTCGTNSFNDGYPEMYKIRKIKNTDVVDGVNLVALTNDTTLVAELIKVYKTHKKYILMADSYGTYDKDGIHYSWTEAIIDRLGLDAINLSQGSRGFAWNTAVGTFLNGIQTAISNGTISDVNEITDIIVCGGTNDMGGIFNGYITVDELNNSVKNFMNYVTATFPNATVRCGMIGGVQAGTYETAWNETLKAYQSVTKYGGGYLKNVEYLMLNYDLFDETGGHPNATGFSMLYDIMTDAILTNSCNVDRYIDTITTTKYDNNLGKWNTNVRLRYLQHNNDITINFTLSGIAFTFTSDTTFDNITTDFTLDGYKLLPVATIESGAIRGNFKILGYVPLRIYIADKEYITMNSPIVAYGYNLYVGLMSNNSTVKALCNPSLSYTGSPSDSITVRNVALDNYCINFDVSHL